MKKKNTTPTPHDATFRQFLTRLIWRVWCQTAVTRRGSSFSTSCALLPENILGTQKKGVDSPQISANQRLRKLTTNGVTPL
ncbi:hypothetical protein DS565_26390 [Salmonella enterica subsp. enterica serovar Bareilly]|nr:hypothetical protein [Salmonella enterica subsp. enterica serovar Bareilly]